MKKFVKLGIVLSLLSSSFLPVFAQAADQANHTYETANLNEGLLDESTISNDEGKEIVEENTEEVTVPDDSATNETNTPADSSTVESTIETESKDEVIESTTQSSEVESQKSSSAPEEKTETEAQGTPVEIDSYVTITSEQFDIWKDFDWTPTENKEQFFQKTFHVKEYYLHENGKKYFSLYSNKDLLIGYIEESQVTVGEGPAGAPIKISEYVTVTNGNHDVWSHLYDTKKGTSSTLLNKTYLAKEFYSHYDGVKYYSLYDKKGTWYGYLNSIAVTKGKEAYGAPIKTNEYVTVTNGNHVVWSHLYNSKKGKSSALLNKTYLAKEFYTHYDGIKYYSLYDKNGTWYGYLNSVAVTKGNGAYGAPIKTNEYVTVTNGNHVIWSHLYNSKKGKSSALLNKTYLAKEFYTHYDGIKYYSLYDKKGTWYGYLNSVAVTKGNGAYGAPIKANEYVTVTNGNHVVWSHLYNSKKGKSSALLNKTYLAKEFYTHYDGIKYYSLYDKNGKWYGYLNSVAVTKGNGAYGAPIKTNEYVTVTNGSHVVWSHLYNSKKGKSSALLNKTYLAKVSYTHYDGIKYYSLYDKNGKWYGYLNSVAVKKGNGKAGALIPISKYVTVSNPNHVIWNSFYNSKRGISSSLYNKSYQVKGYYTHYDGITYYSLYDQNGKWMGYLNKIAVREKKTAASYMGTSRAKIVNELSRHQNDNFYLGTPYKGLGASGYSNAERFMVPRGAPNGYGVGMNCTGFIAYVVKKTGAKMGSITNVANAYGGLANAYNWRDALLKNTMSYSFNSVDELLKSGKAKKGDIIYFEADFTKPNYDCHIAFFWGNTPSENKTWHQVGRGNMISNIFSGTPYSKVYLIPLD